ncbi:Sugar transporter 11, partial [Operophtera brumata]
MCLVDRIGRKYTILVACVPKVASGLLYIFASEVWMLLLGRAIAGASDAKEIRGSLGTILQIVCSIGVVTMLCVGPFTPYITLNVIYTAIIVVTTLPLLLLPHSPYFLYSKGSETQAAEELKEYSLQSSPKTSIVEIVTNKTFLKSFILVLVLGSGSQFSGFNSVSFYLQTILESTQTSITPELCSVIIGLIQLLASFCTTLVTDRFGRKQILTSTLTGLALVLFVTTKYFPLLIYVIGPAATYWFFSMNCLLVCIFIMYFIPETKGKSFAEIQLASGLLYIFASEVWMLLLGRAIAGASDAAICTVLPMYASEVASKEIRGSLGTILQIVCSIGVVTMLCVGPFTPYITLNVMYTSIIVVTTLPLLLLPHSPYFLYSKGSETQAAEELKEYSLQSSPKTSIVEIVTNKTFLKSFILVLVLASGSQFSGFNSVSFYLQTILESTQTSITPELCSVIIGLIQLLASFCTTLVTDRFGRKQILTSTLTGLALGMVTELFDDRSRGVGLSITSILSFIILFVTTKYFPLLIYVIGPAATYWFFSMNCLL